MTKKSDMSITVIYHAMSLTVLYKTDDIHKSIITLSMYSVNLDLQRNLFKLDTHQTNRFVPF
jgi:hypothetical protein